MVLARPMSVDRRLSISVQTIVTSSSMQYMEVMIFQEKSELHILFPKNFLRLTITTLIILIMPLSVPIQKVRERRCLSVASLVVVTETIPIPVTEKAHIP